MKRTSRRLVFVILLFQGMTCLAQTPSDGPAPADSMRHLGLMFVVEASPHLSSLTSYAYGGYSFSLGFGLNISPMLQVTLQVYTGKETIPAGSAKPVDGWLPLGGASLEATFFFTSGFPLRPYGAAGYGLYTINGNDGYNGGGPHFEAGVEWDFSQYFSIRGGARYNLTRYHDPTGEASQSAGFQPFTTHLIGAAIRCSFYPSVRP